MATTTNYGWTTPDDTALVKDGASAIRALGSSVDTTTKALNPETTLGDIVYRSSTANVKTRLGIGSTGQVLTVASGVPSWATPGGGGGMTLLSTTSLSGTTTISSISQSYKNLYIVAKAMVSTNNNISFYAQFNGSTASDYTWGTTGATMGSAAYLSSSGATNLFPVGHSNGLTGFTNENQFIMQIPRYTETEKRYYTVSYYGADDRTNPYRYAAFVGAVYNDTTAITSLTILASGNAAYTGTLYIYGVN
jgi:hypothetical protein